MSKLHPKSLLFCLSFLLVSFLSNAQQKNIRFDRYAIEDGLSQSSVTGVVQDNLGFIWVATQDGLNRYDGYDFLVFKSIPEDNSTLPTTIYTFYKKMNMDIYGLEPIVV